MHLGVCYYPEHWPADWWPADARAMADMGITHVRIGDYSWSRIEPQRGRLAWDWLDRAIETLAGAGLRIILCTPTAAPPKWLVDRHPGVLAIGPDGRPRGFGSRRHYDFSSDVYFEQARRITTRYAQRYAGHPAVVAWQLDSEYGRHDTVVSYSPAAVARFRLWLRQRYGSIERLNELWGNVFWSMEYTSFDEVEAPVGAVAETNPAHRLDYRRFASDEVLRFNRMQCDILRAHAPGRPVTHNFMPFSTGFDHCRLAADLDLASWDNYPLGALESFWFSDEDRTRWMRSGHPDFAAFHHDLYRGMSRQPFWVMEQQSGPVNWARWNAAPAPGAVRLWTWEAFAHGAGAVGYFRWRQVPFGQEQMHGGLHRPDRQPEPAAAEVRQVAQELRQLQAAGAGARVAARPAPVALVFDYEAQWALQAQPHGTGDHGLQQAFTLYSVLRSLGLDVDIVPAGSTLAGRAMVVVPGLPIVSSALLAELQATPAQVLLYPRCGSKVEALRVPPQLPPGLLQALVPVRVTRVEALRPGSGDRAILGGRDYACLHWREHLELLGDVHAEARYTDGGVAVARRGRVRYLAGEFEGPMLRALCEAMAREAGLAPRTLPDGLRWRRCGELLFAFNYSGDTQLLDNPGGRWVLGGPQLEPHDVAVAHMPEASWGEPEASPGEPRASPGEPGASPG